MQWLTNLLGIKPNNDQFARMVEKKLKAKGVTGQFVYDPQKFCINVIAEDGATAGYYLGNAYSEYCNAPAANRQGVLDAFFGDHIEIPDTLNEAIPNVMPRLMMRLFFACLPLSHTNDGESNALPYQVIAEHYAAGLVYDGSTQVAYLSEAQLKTWSIDVETLMERAVTNLARITPEPFQRVKDGLYYSAYNDTYDATRLLDKHRVNECRVKGRPLAITPSRNHLFICGEDDVDAQSIMLDLVDNANDPRPTPAFPMVLDGATWNLWNAPSDHPQRKRFEMLRLVGLSQIYGEQKEDLDEKNEAAGQDIYVASYMAFDHDQHGLTSMAPLTKGVPTMLPQVDQVTFVDPDAAVEGVVGAADWDSFVQIFGDRLKPQGLYPERYFVNSFPTKEEIESMKASAPYR
jgi:hypothetical protein